MRAQNQQLIHHDGVKVYNMHESSQPVHVVEPNLL